MHHLDLSCLPSCAMLARLSHFCHKKNDRHVLWQLSLSSSHTDGKENFYARFQATQATLLDVLTMFPSCMPPPEHLLACLSPIAPRMYSVSSVAVAPVVHQQRNEMSQQVSQDIVFTVCLRVLELRYSASLFSALVRDVRALVKQQKLQQQSKSASAGWLLWQPCMKKRQSTSPTVRGPLLQCLTELPLHNPLPRCPDPHYFTLRTAALACPCSHWCWHRRSPFMGFLQRRRAAILSRRSVSLVVGNGPPTCVPGAMDCLLPTSGTVVVDCRLSCRGQFVCR